MTKQPEKIYYDPDPPAPVDPNAPEPPELEVNHYKDELPRISRINYIGASKVWIAFHSARLLFGATVASVAGMIFFGVGYLIPAVLVFIFLLRLFSSLLQKVLFKFIPKTKANRWTVNSTMHLIYTFPLWVWTPGSLVFGVSMFVLPVYMVVKAMNGVTGSEMILPWLLDMFNYTSFSEFFIKFFFWDSNFVVLSLIKVAGLIISPFCYYHAHPEVSRWEFLDSDDDCGLQYEFDSNWMEG